MPYSLSLLTGGNSSSAIQDKNAISFMKTMSKFMRFSLVGYCLVTVSCTQKTAAGEHFATFVASTLCPDEIRALHNIPATAKCEVVKWKLELYRDAETPATGLFILSNEWGFHINNATFETSGKNSGIKGKWEIVKGMGKYDKAEIYTFYPEKSGQTVSFLKMNDNLLHLLNKEQQLSIGSSEWSGGWSNTLNRIDPLPDAVNSFKFTDTKKDKYTKVEFHGRTPCQEIAKEIGLEVDIDCAKIKWLITFFRDSLTRAPTIFEIKKNL